MAPHINLFTSSSSTPRAPNTATIRVRINCIDSYQSKSSSGPRRPVVRVYGPLDVENGEQAVVHVHGAYPFLYVAIPRGEPAAAHFARQLRGSLEAALSEAFHRPVRPGGFVHDVVPCRAFDFYGFAPAWSRFVKVTLFNPIHTYKCADLLRTGAVAGRPLQPYESHIPYLLAFLADYDLYGCNWLEFDRFSERAGPARSVFSGREFDVDVEHILNQVRDQTLPFSITSLSEARDSDTRWRRAHGLAPWAGPKLLPTFQQSAFDWPWERAAEHRRKLRERIQENAAAEGADSADDTLALPTVGRLRCFGGASQTSGPRPDSNSSVEAASILGSESRSNSDLSSESVQGRSGLAASPVPTQADAQEPMKSLDPSLNRRESLNVDPVERTQADSPPPTVKAGKFPLDSPDPNAGVREIVSEAREIVSDIVSDSHEIVSDDSFLAASFSIHSSAEKPDFGSAFCSRDFFQFSMVSPSTKDVVRTNGISSGVDAPFFGNALDVPPVPFTYGQKSYQLRSHDPIDLDRFETTDNPFFPRLVDPLDEISRARVTHKDNTDKDSKRSSHKRHKAGDDTFFPSKRRHARMEYAVPSPTTTEVRSWLESVENRTVKPPSQMTLSGHGSAYQFGSLGKRESTADEMSVCVIEVHVNTRFGKVPKASEDSIAAVFWRVSDEVGLGVNTPSAGIITTNPILWDATQSVLRVGSEREILDEVIKMVRFYNPDILTGFEILTGSWGYLQARYATLQESRDRKLSFYEMIGRVEVAPMSWKPPGDDEGVAVLGRHVLNLWNLLRHEVTLSKYTFEYVVYHTLHERTPYYSYDELHRWWQSGESTALNSVVAYFSQRTSLILRLLEHFELINRTCEKSRIIGIDFYSSLTRGSQFQVEAVLCRLARKQNYVLISPSKHQVGQQNALEFIPLVMEPRSQYYTDPVCVLDFRSLYPSIVIAFNLCYSTCLGNVSLWRNRNKIGIKQDYPLPPHLMADIGEDQIYVAPNGMAYVAPQVRQSLLAQMLGEILDTRFMVNSTRKSAKGMWSDDSNKGSSSANRRFQRNLNNRQLALKFIANVTYGYTSASFSGRMPLAELADSIVSAGREILESSIRKLESPVNKWGVKPEVVYGDTDSLFVRIPGVTREAAFKIGEEMADLITQSTPDPILLKLEKVYHPCILLTKKRYVGNSYESPLQTEATFDAKGIETVRRDGTPIVQKVEKRALEILFSSSNLSKVKKYLQSEWRRILSNQCRIQDFCFAQEVKLGHYKETAGESNLPGGAVVSLRKMQKDDGFEPQYRERVPFIVTAGPLGSRINDRVVSPEEFMSTPHMVVDFEYYIQKAIIPPLERLFNLMGANVRSWYSQMPRIAKVTGGLGSGLAGGLRTFLESDNCRCCFENRREPPSVLCKTCGSNKPRSRYILLSRRRAHESALAAAQTTCNLCGMAPRVPVILGGELDHPCKSIDCPVYYDRKVSKSAVHETGKILELF